MKRVSKTGILSAWAQSLAGELPVGWSQSITRAAAERWLFILLSLLVSAGFMGRAAPDAVYVRDRQISMMVANYDFDLLRWEAHALGEKGQALLAHPAQGIDITQGAARVKAYVERAHRVSELETVLSLHLGEGDAGDTPEQAARRSEIARLRAVQDRERPVVEEILQRQVSSVLAENGFGVSGKIVPPVFFTFTEPPQTLVVSPRNRIVNVYQKMLTPEMTVEDAETVESTIYEQMNLSAYVTRIGGLGAFPTMVIDRSSLPWIVSTVAHEWTHNYLTMFPLGMLYGSSPQMKTLNETVADIVGDEIGEQVLRRYYPEFASPPEQPPEATPEEGEGEPEPPPRIPYPTEFDFDREMRETRLRVDGLLRYGLVDAAERYMETRRKFFVAHGYPIRVLNQAYFAFHGSYGTTAFSPSYLSGEPVLAGPSLEQLRELSPNLLAFVHRVRWFTSMKDLQEAITNLERQSEKAKTTRSASETQMRKAGFERIGRQRSHNDDD